MDFAMRTISTESAHEHPNVMCVISCISQESSLVQILKTACREMYGGMSRYKYCDGIGTRLQNTCKKTG